MRLDGSCGPLGAHGRSPGPPLTASSRAMQAAADGVARVVGSATVISRASNGGSVESPDVSNRRGDCPFVGLGSGSTTGDPIKAARLFSARPGAPFNHRLRFRLRDRFLTAINDRPRCAVPRRWGLPTGRPRRRWRGSFPCPRPGLRRFALRPRPPSDDLIGCSVVGKRGLNVDFRKRHSTTLNS